VSSSLRCKRNFLYPAAAETSVYFTKIEYGFPISHDEGADAYDLIRSHKVYRDLNDRGESKILFSLIRTAGRMDKDFTERENVPMV
jgi:hypothetical protein